MVRSHCSTPTLTISSTEYNIQNAWRIKQLNKDPVYYERNNNYDGVSAYIMGSFAFERDHIIEMHQDIGDATKGEVLASWSANYKVIHVEHDKAIKNITSMLKSTHVLKVDKEVEDSEENS